MRRFDVFGRLVGAERVGGEWITYYLSDEGKRRLAHDIFVPPSVKAGELRRYLADLCHEWASPERADVREIAN